MRKFIVLGLLCVVLGVLVSARYPSAVENRNIDDEIADLERMIAEKTQVDKRGYDDSDDDDECEIACAGYADDEDSYNECMACCELGECDDGNKRELQGNIDIKRGWFRRPRIPRIPFPRIPRIPFPRIPRIPFPRIPWRRFGKK